MKILYSALLILFFTVPVFSQWFGDPTVNNPICTHSSYQYDPTMVPDGSGGAIIAWEDDRNANADGGYNYDIYAQRIDSMGIIRWTINGISVCGAAHTQQEPVITSDGAGGAIIAWADSRLTGTAASYFDIYAQRINGNGVAMWAADGVRITTTSTVNNMHCPAIVSDGGNGAIVAWEDMKVGSYRHLYAQKLDPVDGHSLWAVDGLNVCTNASQEREVVMISDGYNGAILTWEDFRSPWRHTYAQRIDNSGNLLWTNDALAVCATVGENQYNPSLVSDGLGGAVFAYRNDASTIFSQRVLSNGSIIWTTGGAVASVGNSAMSQFIASDQNHGAFIAWHENRGGNPTFDDIYAQRVDGTDGHAMWTTNGVAVCNLAGNQFYPKITTDVSGAAIVAWTDLRANYDIYAEKLDPTDGHSLWTANGVPVSTNVYDQKFTDPGSQSSVIMNHLGETIITWLDSRTSGNHVYCSKLNVAGALPVELTSFTAKNMGSRIALNWTTATEVNNMGFDIERRLNSTSWNKIAYVNGSVNSNTTKNYSYVDINPGSGKIEYRLKQIDVNGSFKYSTIVEVSSVIPAKFDLSQNFPNPFNPTTVIQYSIPKAEYVTLKVYDELGKEVITLVNENREAGFYSVNFNGANLSSGIYIYKITAGDFTSVKKLLLMK